MTPTSFDGEAFLERLWMVDEGLVRCGFPPTSPWWRAEIERFIRALAAGDDRRMRRWVIRAGRRAGKSSTLARLAVVWAMVGPWSVPRGDIGVVAFVSVSKDEAGARMRTIAAILDALKLEYEQRTDEIELNDKRSRHMLFKVYAATTRATVGFTGILVIGDESARYESRDTAANPAGEVFASLAPTLATQRYGFTIACSSPWGADDWHAQRFDEGDTDHQLVSFAPTWVANPTITEADTHAFEPDERVWSREYAAVPGATVSAAFDALDVEEAFNGSPNGRPWRAFVATDPSSLRGDAFTYLAGRETDADELDVREVGGWSGDELRRVSMADIVAKISDRAHTWNTRVVYADQRESAALASLYAQQGVSYDPIAWTEASKDEAVMLLRRLMRERRLFLPDHAELKRELLAMKARLQPSGRVRYESNGLDYASALITLAHAIVQQKVLNGAHQSHYERAPLERAPHPLWGHNRPTMGQLWGSDRDTRRRT
jgi:hypothetical protein